MVRIGKFTLGVGKYTRGHATGRDWACLSSLSGSHGGQGSSCLGHLCSSWEPAWPALWPVIDRSLDQGTWKNLLLQRGEKKKGGDGDGDDRDRKSKRFCSFPLQYSLHLFSYNIQQLPTRFIQCCLSSETLKDKRTNAQASNALLSWLSTKGRSFLAYISINLELL